MVRFVPKRFALLAVGALVIALSAALPVAYGGIRSVRERQALEVAAGFYKAVWAKDADGLATVLPPGLASEMTHDDYRALWSFFDCRWIPLGVVANSTIADFHRYRSPDVRSDGCNDVTIWFRCDDAGMEGATSVRATMVLTGVAAGARIHLEEQVDLVWIAGGWRVARLEANPAASVFVFHAEGREPGEVLAALRERQGRVEGMVNRANTQ